MNKNIPYKIYLNEDEMPKAWYNLRADMKQKPAPLLNPNTYQPIKAEENAAQGVDLELSGHTHAGQIWPMGLVTEFFGALNYGLYQEENCKVIVSSGTAGWAYTVRTGEHCEYVLIDLIPSEKES